MDSGNAGEMIYIWYLAVLNLTQTEENRNTFIYPRHGNSLNKQITNLEQQKAHSLEVIQSKKSEKQADFQENYHFWFNQYCHFERWGQREMCSVTLAAYYSHGHFRLSSGVCSFDVMPLCVCVCEQVVGEPYRDDIQDAEKAVYTITWVNLLHHTLFAILETRNNT